MRTVVLFLLCICFSCGNKPRVAEKNDSAKDSASTIISIPVFDSILAGEPYEKWFTESRLNSKTIKVLRARSDYHFDSDMDADDFSDSLFSVKDEKLRDVYFYAFTRTLKYADGYYSEGAGIDCKRYVETRFGEFCKIFAAEKLLTGDDLSHWAKSVFGEIQISCGNKEKACVDELISRLKKESFSLPKEEAAVAGRFVSELRLCYSESEKH